jgi:hypothetical protein
MVSQGDMRGLQCDEPLAWIFNTVMALAASVVMIFW